MSAPRSRVRMAQPLEYGAVMPDAHPVAVTEPVRGRRGARLTRWLGSFLIVAGVCVLGWTLLVWQWQDPFTALYTRWEQRQLSSEFAALVKDEASKPPVVAADAPPAVARKSVRGAAQRFRAAATEGAPIGRLVVPRLGLDMVMVDGTDSDTLKKGPGTARAHVHAGRGQARLHRRAIARRTRPRSRTSIASSEAIGSASRCPTRRSSTRSRGSGSSTTRISRCSSRRGREEVALQACHPRFFATQRYIVWGRPVEIQPRGGRPYRVD